MPIAIQCTGCGKRYKLRDELAGKRVKCRCGHGMVVPSPAAASESDDGTYGVAPVTDPGGISSLLDEGVSPDIAGPPLPARVLASPSGGSLQAAGMGATADELVAEQMAKEAGATRRAAGLLALAILAGMLVVGAVVFVIIKLVFRPGFATPEDAIAAYQAALDKKDWEAQLRTMTPESQEKTLGGLASMALVMAESSSDIRGILKRQGVEAEKEPDPLAEAALSAGAGPSADAEQVDFEELTRKMEERQKRLEERRQRLVSSVEDKPAFYAELKRAIEAAQDKEMPNNPLLRTFAKKEREEPRRIVARATFSDLEIDGNTAKGKLALALPGQKVDAPVTFKRVDGRWFVHTAEADQTGSFPLRFLPGFGGLLP
jgi:hypothetical protein